jgi:hypothetical protein
MYTRNIRPYGNLLTLSRYYISFNKEEFNIACKKLYNFEKLNYSDMVLYDKVVFSAMGFDSYESMDYSEFEGADIVHDLSNPNVPEQYSDKYDFIIDGGTIEHISNPISALQCVHKMLKIGGTFYFNQPIFYGVNHGFFNFSPQFFTEYYKSNKYIINNMTIWCAEYDTEAKMTKTFKKINTSIKDMCGDNFRINTNYYYMMCGSVTKTNASTCNSSFVQENYKSAHKLEDNTKVIIETLARANSECRVFLYGTGYFSRSLISILNKENINKLNYGGILSNSSEEIGRGFMYGVNVYDISIVKPSDIIIIASLVYRDIIYDRIKYLENDGVKIIKLH